MGRPLYVIATATVLAGPALAQDLSFDGLWRANPTVECVYTGGDGSALKIEDRVLYGAETTCDMTNPVNVNEMEAILYDMECEAEDDEFQDRAMFMTAADGGLYLIWNGFAFKYEACGDDPALGTVTTSDQVGIGE